MRLQLKTMPLGDFQRRRIISQWTQADGKRTLTEIRKILALEGTITTHQTIRNIIARWQETGPVKDRPRIGQAKTISLSHYCLINEALAPNDELTAGDLKKLLVEKFGDKKVTYSERTIARAQTELGWSFTCARYCQAIRDANKEKKRVVWVNKWLEDEEQSEMSYSQMNVLYSLSLTEDSPFARKMHPGSLRTVKSTLPKFMYGPAFQREELPD